MKRGNDATKQISEEIKNLEDCEFWEKPSIKFNDVDKEQIRACTTLILFELREIKYELEAIRKDIAWR
jgi:hypothetical protein